MNVFLRSALCSLFFFLTMGGYYILKPVREAYFLQTQSMDRVAAAHFAVSIATFFVVQVYAWIARRVAPRRLVIWANGVFVLTILAFRAALAAEPTGTAQTVLAWSYYIWVSIFSVFAVTLFWSFTHDVFTTDEGSRYYGLVGAGGILGGVAGGVLTEQLVARVGVADLLILSAASLIPGMIIVAWLSARVPSTGGRGAKGKGGGSVRATDLFASSRYLLAIVALVFLYQALAVLVDYQTKLIVKQAFPDRTQLTAFMGKVYWRVNVIGTAINLLLTGWLQTRVGPLPGLASLPVVGLAGAVGFFATPVLAVAEWVTILGLAVTYSCFQAGKELLYLPVPSDERYVAKAFIDTFVFRLGNGAAALWLMIVAPASGAASASGMIMATCAGMIAAAVWLSRRHAAIVAGRETALPKEASA